MTTTTEITSNAAAYLTGNIAATLTLWATAGEFADDFDMDAANAEYAAEVERIMQSYAPTWSLAGDFIYAQVDRNGCLIDGIDEDQLADVAEELGDIDYGAILARHEKVSA